MHSSRARQRGWLLQTFAFLIGTLCLHHPFLGGTTFAQTFTKITDPANPLAGDLSVGNYFGCAWGDYDDDGLEDMIMGNQNACFLYHNDGGGSFTRVPDVEAGDIATLSGIARGVTWGDYDNDGRLDCFVTGDASGLFRNNGAAPWFSKVTTADIGTTDTRGWSPAWADYDNDGNLDLVIACPNSFVGGGICENQMFHGDGPPNYTFTRVDTGVIVTGPAPYTSATWSDYDLDGDVDLFIGTGPASSTAGVDFLYQNLLLESGVPGFSRIMTAPIATDGADGQVWNWIDYDNDGDLDGHRTNWGGGNILLRPNDLYRNDGGTYVAVTSGAIVTDPRVSLSAVWEDLDNDGDRDCFVSNDNGQANSYYRNNGDGTFTAVVGTPLNGTGTSNYGATAGDMDNDGDLDLFVAGTGTTRYLLRNDTSPGNNWLRVKCEGVVSNRSAIGTRIWVVATIGGNSVRQHREIQAQNSFLCHSSLIMHFGLGDATDVDSVIVEWPSGEVNVLESIAPNQLISVIEECADSDGDGVACFDNCPSMSNPTQEDADLDGVGDVCDNCPSIANSNQADVDGDGIGNLCDNCPATANALQDDGDLDGVGDACDNCPAEANLDQADADGDGVGDLCDNCPSVANPAQEDGNGNGIGDVCDCACPFQCDLDGNSFVDAVDLAQVIDIVFFGAAEIQDPDCPVTRADFNADGFADAVDLATVIDHVFFGGPGPADPCVP